MACAERASSSLKEQLTDENTGKLLQTSSSTLDPEQDP